MNDQKLDTSIDRNLPDDQDYASISRKVISLELSHGSSTDLYSRCPMEFASNVVQTKAPQFVDLGLPAVNISDEFSILGTPVTRIIRPTDGSHWSAPDHVFGEETVVGMSAARLDQYYSYKTDFKIWRENQDFGRQNIFMSRPPLDSTPIGTNTTNIKTSQLDSTPIGEKLQKPRHERDQWNRQSEKENHMYQRTRSQTHHCQTHHQSNLIRPITVTIEKDRRKNSNSHRKEGRIKNMRKVNGKAADDSA